MDKDILLKKCFTVLSERISDIQDAIQNAETALSEDTKSSAGDKYETSREMLQQDLDRLEMQMKVALVEKEVLQRIEALKATASVGLGSIIHTDDGLCYFVAIGIGKMEVADASCYVISLASPLGQAMQGKRKGDFFEINNSKRKIKEVA